MSTSSRDKDFKVSMVSEVTGSCLLTRTRRISRVITGIYEQELRPFGVNAPQFSMLILIARLGHASRAEIARANYQERSTSTRNLQLILSAGWVEEVEEKISGRSRPIRISQAGKDVLAAAMPAWRTAQSKAEKLLGQAGTHAIFDLAESLPAES